jgi:hypothetical protein
MQTRRLITIMTLIAFLPLAVGCSATRTVALDSDPASADVISKLQSGEPVKILGYTRASGGYRRWDGHARVATADSLEFGPGPSNTKSSAAGAPGFRLPIEDVISVDVAEPDAGATTAVVVLVVLAAGAVVLAVVGAAMANSFDGMGME